MLDRMVAKASQQEVFCREDTPTERRVIAAFYTMLASLIDDRTMR